MEETLVIACFQIIVTYYYLRASRLKGPAIDLLKLFMLACLIQVLCKLGLLMLQDGTFLLTEFAQPFNLTFGPLLYLSYRAVKSGRKPALPDLLHAVPFVFYLVYSNVVLMIYNSTGNETIVSNYTWWTFLGFILSFCLYGGLILIDFFRSKREETASGTLQTQLYAGLSIALLSFALPTVVLYFGFSRLAIVNLWGYVCMVSIFLLILYHLFLLEKKVEEEKQREKYHNSGLDLSSMEEILMELDRSFSELKIYLDEDLSLKTVSRHTGFPAHKITQSLSVIREKHFNEYVNDHRIRECLQRIKTGDVDSIRSLYIQCGFKSRSTFLRAFKKHTEMTPSVYLAYVDEETKG